MKNKIFVFLLALAMCLSLVACGGDEAADGSWAVYWYLAAIWRPTEASPPPTFPK